MKDGHLVLLLTHWDGWEIFFLPADWSKAASTLLGCCWQFVPRTPGTVNISFYKVLDSKACDVGARTHDTLDCTLLWRNLQPSS